MCIAGIARCGLPACENRKTNGKDTNRSHQYRQPARSVQWIAHRDAGRRPWLRTVLWRFLPYFHALEGLTRSTRLHKVFPVALGPAFVQLSVQLQRALQPKIRLQKGLIPNELVQCRRRVGVLRLLLWRNQYCNLGCKKCAPCAYTPVLQLSVQPYSKAKINKEKTNSMNTKNRRTQKIG